MDDDSDDGNWKGESQFIRDENRFNDIDEDFDDENNNQFNEGYRSYNRNEDKNNEDDNDNQDFKSNNDYYYDDDYYDDDYNEDYYDYDENNNNEYNYKYNYNNGYNNRNNYNRNDNHYNNNEFNRQYRNNNYKRRYRPIFHSRKAGESTSIKTKEFYLSTFRIKFKLWLMIVIKLLEKSKKKIVEDEKINEEIYESFINLYNYKKDKNKNEIKNNLNFEIENIEIKKIIKDIYNIEFNIIITEELKIYFTKKYINIKVTGKVYKDRYPKFFFQLMEYKLELNDESKDYDNKKKDNSRIIIDIKGKELKSDLEIGMQPDYSIKNKNFKKYLEELQWNDSEEYNDDKKKKKGPQEEIIDIFFELNEIINKEKKTEKSSK